MSLFGQDTDLRYRWAVNLPAPWNRWAFMGKTDSDLFPPQAAAIATLAKREVIDRAKTRSFDLVIGIGSKQRVFAVNVVPDRDDAGAVVGLTGSAVEVSAERQRQATLRTLLREVSHRSKNLLAVVQSVAAQTARGASTSREFVEEFNGRLQSLARSQDLVTATDWAGTRLRELIAAQVDPLLRAAKSPVSVAGADPMLSPNAAIHVGLALHELANHAIHRKTSDLPAAPISIEIEIGAPENTDKGRGPLRLRWTEKGRSSNDDDAFPEGFGRTLLTRIVPASVAGSASLDMDGNTFRYALDIGRGEFEP